MDWLSSAGGTWEELWGAGVGVGAGQAPRRRSELSARLLRFLSPRGARPERGARHLPARDGLRARRGGPAASDGRGGRPGTPPGPSRGRSGSAPAPPPAPGARHPPGIRRRARFRRWQRWPSAERPAMAGAPGPLRLALLLLGAVGRAGPRPQVRPADPGEAGGRGRGGRRAQGPGRGGRDLSETPRPQAEGTESLGGVRTGELGALGWVAELGAWTADHSPGPGEAPASPPPGPHSRASAAPRPPCADLCAAALSPDHFPNSFSSDSWVCGPGTARDSPPPRPHLSHCARTPSPQCQPPQPALLVKDPEKALGGRRGPGGGHPAPFPAPKPPSTAFES